MFWISQSLYCALILKKGICNDEENRKTFLSLSFVINHLEYAVYKKDIQKKIERCICSVFTKRLKQTRTCYKFWVRVNQNRSPKP